MSKQDFEALAKALGEAKDLDDAVANVIAALVRSNPAFSPTRFRAAVVEAYVAKFARSEA